VEHDEQEHVRTEHAGFRAPPPGGAVREEELGEMLPHDEIREEGEDRAPRRHGDEDDAGRGDGA
jgi:hypothetical protein